MSLDGVRCSVLLGGSITERMRLLGNGKLGIGTTNPLSKFHVKIATNENIRLSGTGGDTRISALNDASSAVTQLSIQGNPLHFRGYGGAAMAR